MHNPQHRITFQSRTDGGVIMRKAGWVASSVLAVALGLPSASQAQYGGGGAAAGGVIGGIFGSIMQQQQQQAREQERANRAYQQQQYDAQQQAAAAARQAEFDRQQVAIRQQAAIRAKHDADAKEAAHKVALAKEEADQQAAAEKAKTAAAAAEDARLAALTRQKAQEQDAKTVADRLEAAQALAEESPANHCREQTFAKVVLENFNKFKVLNRLDRKVIDIEHLTTDKYNEKMTDMVCHGTFLFDNGEEVAGDFEIRKNVAGDLIYLWSADAADGGRAHLLALNAGPVRDLQAVTGTGGASAPRVIVIPASDTDKGS